MKNHITKIAFIAISLCCTSTYLWAQSPVKRGLQAITSDAARAHIYYLAGDSIEGRGAGSRGGYIAGEYIISRLREAGVKPLYSDYRQPFDVYGHTYATEPAKAAGGKGSPASKEQSPRQTLNNILGVIKGEKSNEIVIVGAHYDHLGRLRKEGSDVIMNGADDNASGTAGLLQIMKAFTATGQRPKRTVIFALWDGEERGMLGSTWFLNHFADSTRIKSYMNLDMMGRNSDEAVPQRFSFLYTTERGNLFENWFKRYIAKYGFQLKPDYKPHKTLTDGSDNAPFGLRHIPIVWPHTEGHPDMHRPTDDAAKINYEKTTEISRAAFLILWRMANE